MKQFIHAMIKNRFINFLLFTFITTFPFISGHCLCVGAMDESKELYMLALDSGHKNSFEYFGEHQGKAYAAKQGKYHVYVFNRDGSRILRRDCESEPVEASRCVIVTREIYNKYYKQEWYIDEGCCGLNVKRRYGAFLDGYRLLPKIWDVSCDEFGEKVREFITAFKDYNAHTKISTAPVGISVLPLKKPEYHKEKSDEKNPDYICNPEGIKRTGMVRYKKRGRSMVSHAVLGEVTVLFKSSAIGPEPKKPIKFGGKIIYPKDTSPRCPNCRKIIEKHLEKYSGKISVDIPNCGMYFLCVPEGKEAEFIDSITKEPLVENAFPSPVVVAN